MNLLRSLLDPSVPWRKRAIRAMLIVGILLACVLRIWMVFTYNPIDHLWSDPERHWILGTRPLDVQPFAAIDPVAFQVYLGALGKLTTGVPVLVAYWTAWLSLLGPWLWYRFLRELLPQRDWALAGWLALAALPSWSAIYSYFMQETLMLPLLGAALWATWRCRRKGSAGSFVLATGLWMMAGLTRGICIPLGAVAMVWLWIEQGERLAKAAASLALVLAVLGPLAGRSWSLTRMISPHGVGQLNQLYQRSGAESIAFEFTRHGGAKRWTNVFKSPSVGQAPLTPLSDWQSRREGTAQFSVDLDAGRRDWQLGQDRLPPWDWSRAVWLTGDNLIHLFFGPSWPDTNRERWIGELNFLARWIWAPLTLACVTVTLILWRRQRERLLLALILTWFAVQGLFPLSVNEGRYRKPFEGLLVAQCLLLAASLRRVSATVREPAGLSAATTER